MMAASGAAMITHIKYTIASEKLVPQKTTETK
jgi:hypothetical protein